MSVSELHFLAIKNTRICQVLILVHFKSFTNNALYLCDLVDASICMSYLYQCIDPIDQISKKKIASAQNTKKYS